MSHLNLSFLAIGKNVFKGEAKAVIVPTMTGIIEVLPKHTQLISALKKGEVIIKTSNSELKIKIDKGVLEVQPKSQVIILADLTKE